MCGRVNELLFLGISMIFITMPAARQYTKQTNLTHAYSYIAYENVRKLDNYFTVYVLPGYMIRCDRHNHPSKHEMLNQYCFNVGPAS